MKRGSETLPVLLLHRRGLAFALVSKDVADFAIYAGSVASGVVDQFDPPLIIVVQSGLAEQVRGLHDGFDRVAEIVGQGA